MALMYFDSSRLTKRYVPEAGSAWVQRICERDPIAISRITVAEVASALARRTREGHLTPDERDRHLHAFRRDIRLMTVGEVLVATAADAAALLLAAPTHIRLRTLDMLHVATARALFAEARSHGVPTGSFVSADLGQLAAAA